MLRIKMIVECVIDVIVVLMLFVIYYWRDVGKYGDNVFFYDKEIEYDVNCVFVFLGDIKCICVIG